MTEAPKTFPFPIKSAHQNTKPVFECELDAEYQDKPASLQLGEAVKIAVQKKVYLRGADLRRADLQGADLHGADLQGANLQGANLQGADLWGAYLQGAYLRGANLQGADLQGADLQGADLRGADLQEADLRGAYLQGADLQGANLRDSNGEKNLLRTKKSILQIGPVGSRGDYLIAYDTTKGIYIKAGCFFDTLEVFKESVEETHGNNQYAQEYEAVIAMIESVFETRNINNQTKEELP